MTRFPSFLRWIYPGAVWNIPAHSKVVYLTFDDGPTPIITTTVLNLLAEYQAKGTFFCIGKNCEEHPDLFLEIVQKGHHIGSHTYSHLNGWKVSADEYLQDYSKGRELVGSNLFRPPYGRLLLKPLQSIQKQDRVVMWDLLSKDYDVKMEPKTILKNIKKNLRPGSIIVFHDSQKAAKNLMAVLPPLLQYLKQEGYTMEAIPYTS
ncbi:MAG: polysaccharide deacetylase family protein [Bacteroidota bacterium]